MRVLSVLLVLCLIIVLITLGYTSSLRTNGQFPLLKDTYTIGYTPDNCYTTTLYYIAWFPLGNDLGYDFLINPNDPTGYYIDVQVEPNMSYNGYYTAVCTWRLSLSQSYTINLPCLFTFTDGAADGIILLFSDPFTMDVVNTLPVVTLADRPAFTTVIGDVFSFAESIFYYGWDIVFNPQLQTMKMLNWYSKG